MTIFKKNGKRYNIWFKMITSYGLIVSGKITNWGGTNCYVLIPSVFMLNNKYKGYIIKGSMKLVAREVMIERQNY